VDAEREALFERQLRDIVLSIVGERPCTVFLFGSRAQAMTRRSSDFDIGIQGLVPDEFERQRRLIVAAVEESHIPHDVDVVDFDRVSEPFLSEARKEIQVWKSA